jgi:hypothetical protein
MCGRTPCLVSGLCLSLFIFGLSTASANPIPHYVNLYSTSPVAPYTDPAKAATNIQDAIDQAAPGDFVIVGPGAYVSGTRATPGAALLNRIAVTNAITIQAYYGPGMTSIEGSGPLGDSGVRCAYLSGGATLVGFTLTNGHTRTSGDALKDCSGGGAYAIGGVLDSCIINGNGATQDAGGILGGTVNKCVIMGNTADAGGGISGGTLYNCLIAGNTAAQNGGGANGGTLNNCTVCGNTASSGGGTYESGANNCVVYYNSAGIDTNWHTGVFSHSCTVPNPGGSGNTSAPPQFESYPTDLHLQPGSPCINAGDNSYVVGDTDLDGNSRIMNTIVDMGAYEVFYVTVNGRVTLDYSGLEGVVVSDGTRSNLTDAAGSYTIGGVSQGSHTLTARKANYIFQPATMMITVTNSDIWNKNFTAGRFHVMAAINCGGPSYTDLNGILYAADTNFSGGTVVTTTDAISNTVDGPLYQNGRQGAFSYSIPLGNTNYLLTLQFAEIQQTGSASRVFNVMAGGSSMTNNLDILAMAGGHDLAYDITKAVTVTNGTLSITFNAGVGSPMLNGIVATLDETGLVSGPMGTPTWWLRQYGLTSNVVAVEEMRDTDGDGMVAWKEYIAGTDPTNKASVLCIADAAQSVSGRLQIAVSTVSNKEYRLRVATNIVSGRWMTCPYATTQNGVLQSAVITAAVNRTVLYVLPLNTVCYYRARIDAVSHPFDAVAYGGHYYKVFDATNSTWHEAKAKCEDMGGYLACIESAGEQAFLTTLANGRYLSVGGTDEDGPWKWVNGSTWVYTAWGSGQPNGSFGVEYYLELFDGGLWNDVADKAVDYGDPPYMGAYWMPVGYICEWEH